MSAPSSGGPPEPALLRSGWIVLLCGVADGLAPVGYLLMGSPVPVQLLGLVLKAGLLVLGGRHVLRRLTQAQLAVLGSIAVLLLVSIPVEVGGPNLTPSDYVGYLTVGISLWLTARLVALRNLDRYARGFALPAVGVGLIHIALVRSGAVVAVSGRFGYVQNLHPNLGGEIAAAGVAAAAMTFRMRTFLACSAVLMYSSFLMQARSAQLAIGITVALRVAYDLLAGARRRSSVWAPWLLGACGVVVLMVWGEALVQFALDDVLLSNDAYRGSGTGFVGREEGWALAVDTFLAHPITGGGVGYVHSFDELAVPHNAVLAGLARHGVISFLFWIPVTIGMVRLWRLRRRTALALAGSVMLILFNARFINLNPYPYLLYACALVGLGPGTRWSRRRRPHGASPVRRDLQPAS